MKRIRKKKMSGLDKYIIFSFSMLILFTISQVIITIVTGIEMTALTGCFFAAFGGEVLMCALIKKMKIKKQDERERYNDEE